MNAPDAEPANEPQRPKAPPPVAPPSGEAELARQLGVATRRGFVTAGVSILAGAGAWRWLASRPTLDGTVWPLRRVLEANERLARGTLQPSRLAPNFSLARVQNPRINELLGMARRGFDPLTWRLNVVGGALGNHRRAVSLAEIKALPRFEQTTELKCIEGWSTIVHWAGARLADLAASTGCSSRAGRPYPASQAPTDLHEYASLTTQNGGYYVGLDTPSALHPQTLLCYEMNGEPLSHAHGAPVRLVIPLKYGIKNIKQVGNIQFTDRRPADYWAERGYDWYSGH